MNSFFLNVLDYILYWHMYIKRNKPPFIIQKRPCQNMVTNAISQHSEHFISCPCLLDFWASQRPIHHFETNPLKNHCSREAQIGSVLHPPICYADSHTVITSPNLIEVGYIIKLFQLLSSQ